MENRETKLQQYEEAALALILDEHAQEDGSRLLAQFEQAKARGEIPAFPAQRDEENRALIRDTFRAEQRRETLRKLGRIGAKAALWFVLLAAIAAATINVADANNQVYIDRFLKNGCSLSEMEDRYVIHLRLYPKTKVQDLEAISSIMATLTAQGYTCTQEYHNDLGGISDPSLYSRYENSQGKTVRLDSCMPLSGKVIVYKDGCTAQELSYMGYDMILVEWEDAREIYWLDDEEGIRYRLYADGLTERQFWDLVYELAKA